MGVHAFKADHHHENPSRTKRISYKSFETWDRLSMAQSIYTSWIWCILFPRDLNVGSMLYSPTGYMFRLKHMIISSISYVLVFSTVQKIILFSIFNVIFITRLTAAYFILQSYCQISDTCLSDDSFGCIIYNFAISIKCHFNQEIFFVSNMRK